MSFGYIGKDGHSQSWGSNSGVLSPSDVMDLSIENKLTTYGQLELIETQTASSQLLNFQNLGDYDIHFMTCNEHTFPAGNQDYGIRFWESGVLETASVYRYGSQEGGFSGNFYDNKSTGANYIRLDNSGSESLREHWYMYFYNLNKSSKYSYVTYHRIMNRWSSGGAYNDAGSYFEWGSGVLPQASLVDGIQVYNSSQTASAGSISLYGIRGYS